MDTQQQQKKYPAISEDTTPSVEATYAADDRSINVVVRGITGSIRLLPRRMHLVPDPLNSAEELIRVKEIACLHTPGTGTDVRAVYTIPAEDNADSTWVEVYSFVLRTSQDDPFPIAPKKPKSLVLKKTL